MVFVPWDFLAPFKLHPAWSYPAQLLLQQLHKGQQLHQDAANRHEGAGPCQPRAAGAKQNVTGRGQMPLLAHVGSPTGQAETKNSENNWRQLTTMET